MARIKSQMVSALARRRRSRLVRASVHLARRWIDVAENSSYDPALNGEVDVIRRALAGAQGPVVFDVGANVGDWSALVVGECGDAIVHSFELVPETATSLERRFANEPRVHVVSHGLSDRPGEVRIKHYPGAGVVSGLTDFPHDREHVWLDGMVGTGASYCSDHGVGHIDLLKIDVEGLDLRVIRGFGDMVDRHQISAIQFEYGMASIVSGDLLRDFYGFLGDRGYSVGKIFPGFVWFRPYDIRRDEDFIGPNFLAVPTDHLDRWT